MSRFLSDPFDQTSMFQFEREPSDVFERVSSAGHSVFSMENSGILQYIPKTLKGDSELTDLDFDLSFDSKSIFENAMSRTTSSKSQFEYENPYLQKNKKKQNKKQNDYEAEIVQPKPPINLDSTESDSKAQPGSGSETEPVFSSSLSSSSSEDLGSERHEKKILDNSLSWAKNGVNVENFDFDHETKIRINKIIENSEEVQEKDKVKEKEKVNEKEKVKEKGKLDHINREFKNCFRDHNFIPLKHAIKENDLQTQQNNQEIEKTKPIQIPIYSNLPQNFIFEYSHGKLSFTQPMPPIDLLKVIEDQSNLPNNN
ncbi:hypothetical protein M0813_14769 [Anaeramoeba flamelloides]|uniref:Uncharacterized protein n=1 Tax=Anaeramoeba flamelloides TaxID=1746091 RepID=A0ABQ8Z3W2_9EUKA|nr:hypothetical protein M0813_14769 [Anaeramoeba flamelloides]